MLFTGALVQILLLSSPLFVYPPLSLLVGRGESAKTLKFLYIEEDVVSLIGRFAMEFLAFLTFLLSALY